MKVHVRAHVNGKFMAPQPPERLTRCCVEIPIQVLFILSVRFLTKLKLKIALPATYVTNLLLVVCECYQPNFEQIGQIFEKVFHLQVYLLD